MSAYRETWQRVKFVAFVTLLLSLLLRLVWMEVRTYNVEIAPRGLITLKFFQESVHTRCADSAWNLLGPTKAPVRVERLSEVGLAGYWMSSPGLASLSSYPCINDSFDAKKLIRMNQWLLVGMLFAAAILSRCITGSWLLALITTVAIMNRGHIVADVGTFGEAMPMALSLLLWSSCAAHFFRTGSGITLAASAVMLAVGVFFDRSFAFLGFAYPLVILTLLRRRRLRTLRVLRSLRQDRRLAQALQPTDHSLDDGFWATQRIRFKEAVRILIGAPLDTTTPPRPQWQVIYERGGLFRSIRVPFAVWTFKRHRAPLIALSGVLFVLGGLATAVALSAGVWWTFGDGDFASVFRRFNLKLAREVALWGQSMCVTPLTRLDFGLIASLVCTFMVARRSPISGAFEAPVFGRFFTASLLLLVLGAFVNDIVDMMALQLLHEVGESLQVRPVYRLVDVVYWIEPALLTVGIASLWQIIRFSGNAKSS